MIQINELLRAEIAKIISLEIMMDNGLITVTHVNCSANLQNATVFISVLPENVSGTALRLLRSHSSVFKKYLKKLSLKYIPRLNWRIDSQERYAAEINNAINEVVKGEKE